MKEVVHSIELCCIVNYDQSNMSFYYRTQSVICLVLTAHYNTSSQVTHITLTERQRLKKDQ